MSTRTTAWGAYKGIAEAIRARILGGEFAPGAALPSESDAGAPSWTSETARGAPSPSTARWRMISGRSSSPAGCGPETRFRASRL